MEACASVCAGVVRVRLPGLAQETTKGTALIPASRSIGRSARTPGGKILPEVPELNSLYRGNFKVKFRRGQVCMVTGPSGAMKSMLTLWLVDRMDVDALYFSADMEESTATTRLAASRTGTPADTIAYRVAQGDAAFYAGVLSESRIQFCYDPNPTIETVWQELAAYVELYDRYPSVIVIDNMMDMVMDGESEYGAMKQMILELKTLARETEAGVFILHHMTESGEGKDRPDASRPSPRRKLLGKVSQTAGLILSVAYDRAQSLFHIAVVKHRNGPDDPDANTYYSFRADPATARFFPRNVQGA
jgi:replicative DNA helicase